MQAVNGNSRYVSFSQNFEPPSDRVRALLVLAEINQKYRMTKRIKALISGRHIYVLQDPLRSLA